MLGPVDLEGWRDDDKEEELRARLDACSEIQLLRGRRQLSSLPGMSRADFTLARSYALNEPLSGDLIRFLALRLKA
jgi:hypothetical protein